MLIPPFQSGRTIYVDLVGWILHCAPFRMTMEMFCEMLLDAFPVPP